LSILGDETFGNLLSVAGKLRAVRSVFSRPCHGFFRCRIPPGIASNPALHLRFFDDGFPLQVMGVIRWLALPMFAIAALAAGWFSRRDSNLARIPVVPVATSASATWLPPSNASPAAAFAIAEPPLDPEAAALATLPPEDVQWVLDEVARTEAVRAMTEPERLQLLTQLASIRMFTVLERQDPMSPAQEEAVP
jgi:hypothetical protein